MVEDEIEVFIECLENYFSKRSNEKIVVETPYLTDNITRILSDFTGVITISGAYRGCVYFTAQTKFLENIIEAHGQSHFNIEILEDAIGEIANTLAGNSRKKLGNNFVISVPNVIRGNSRVIELTEGAHSFVVPLKWFGQSAAMVVSVMDA
ncbi:MAG: chemotaxis protein CheX [Cellvibrionaceae bacterium]|jgi:chemotaxis protein CheX